MRCRFGSEAFELARVPRRDVHDSEFVGQGVGYVGVCLRGVIGVGGVGAVPAGCKGVGFGSKVGAVEGFGWDWITGI